MIELGALRAQARFDVAQALAISQLRERHAQELIQAARTLDLALARVAATLRRKVVQRQMLHHLREHQLARVHRSPRAKSRAGSQIPRPRVQVETSKIIDFEMPFNGLS